MAGKSTTSGRRTVMQLAAAGAPALIAALASGKARAFRAEGLSAADALAYKDRCKGDQFHAASLDQAVARLKAAGVSFDEARLRATLICPICGCPILTGAGR